MWSWARMLPGEQECTSADGPGRQVAVDPKIMHLIPGWKEEPYAGPGIRWWLKQPDNQRL